MPLVVLIEVVTHCTEMSIMFLNNLKKLRCSYIFDVLKSKLLSRSKKVSQYPVCMLFGVGGS